jgi:hypothetical protein
MNKTVIAIVFSVIFASFTVVPNVLALVDDTYDISLLISSSEEEEKKVKDFEVEVPDNKEIDHTLHNDNLASLLNICQNNYSSLFKELTSPPPERSYS